MDDDTVTLRDRDSLEQSRIPIAELADELSRRLGEPWTLAEARRRGLERRLRRERPISSRSRARPVDH